MKSKESINNGAIPDQSLIQGLYTLKTLEKSTLPPLIFDRKRVLSALGRRRTRNNAFKLVNR